MDLYIIIKSFRAVDAGFSYRVCETTCWASRTLIAVPYRRFYWARLTYSIVFDWLRFRTLTFSLFLIECFRSYATITLISLIIPNLRMITAYAETIFIKMRLSWWANTFKCISIVYESFKTVLASKSHIIIMMVIRTL